MINAPSRRMSLRRKRNNKGTDGTGSPVSKKSSPLMDSMNDEVPANVADSQVYKSRRLRNQPTNNDHSSCINNDEQSFHTPIKRQQPREFEHQQQHSPDVPFMSSQLCGTQECEVVWDCNSPGFSKDDLKRMPGGGAGEGYTAETPVAFVVPTPHRLFPRARGRPPPTSSCKNTTAQLEELLDQLTSKENKSERIHVEDLPPLDFKSQRESSGDDSDPVLDEDSTSSTLPLPGLIKHALSQPFDVGDGNDKNEEQLMVPEVKDMNLTSDQDDSLWGDDLNIGICDISEINIVSDTDTRHFVKEKVSVALEKDKVNIGDDVKDVSNVSVDIFDDDLFNDSVIKTTQALEEAMAKKDSGILFTDVDNRNSQESEQRNNLSGYVNISKDKTNQKDVDYKICLNTDHIISGNSSIRHISNVTSINRNSSSVTQSAIVHYNSANNNINKNTTCQTFSNIKVNSSCNQSKSSASSIYNKNIDNHISGDESSCSPVIGKTLISPTNNLQRRVRSSFQLGRIVSDSLKNPLNNTLESNSHVYSVNASKFINKTPINESGFENIGSKNISDNSVHKTAIANIESKGIQNVHVIHPIANEETCQATKAPSIKIKSPSASNYHSVFSNIPSKKSSSDCSNQVGRLTSTGQTARGPIMRSHSTDNAKVTVDLPSVTQRSKSSMDGDVSREFGEDDEFFKSLLSDLPEDEELFKIASYHPQSSVQKCRISVPPQSDECSVNIVKFPENFNSDKPLREENPAVSSHAYIKDEVKTSRQKSVVQAYKTLKTSLKHSHSLTEGRRDQRYFNHTTQASNLHNPRLDTSKMSVNMENSRDDVQNVEKKVDNKASKQNSLTAPQLYTSDILDDDLFEDDVLTLIDEVESQYGSQKAQSEMSNSQQSLSQSLRCTQDEIDRKKEAARRLREEKLKLRSQPIQYS
ncbi:hypothetical protein OTU49_000487 [Cherax quadricarinatus]|uniref:Uncharacterized protein n=2 Tax=Cherax quadricarinatus TaxID=27406 RepID=A0AAW0XQB9_CHEQU